MNSHILSHDKADRLKEELHNADRAERAWSLYLKDYVERKNAEYYNEFINTNDMTKAMEIKRLQMALKEFTQDILSTMDTGKLARKQLEQGGIL